MQLEPPICAWASGHHQLGPGQSTSGQIFPILIFYPTHTSVSNKSLAKGRISGASTPIHSTIFIFDHLLFLCSSHSYWEFKCVTVIPCPEFSILWHSFWPLNCFCHYSSMIPWVLGYDLVIYDLLHL